MKDDNVSHLKILVISDTHFTNKFNPTLYNYLVDIISIHDHVIINGDFFDGNHCKFNDFVSSDWSKLFPLLLSKRTTYIFGNADPKETINNNVKLFSVRQAERIKLKWHDSEIYLEHGDGIKKGLASLSKNYKFSHIISKFVFKFEKSIANVFGKKSRAIFFYRNFDNSDIISAKKRNLHENDYLICGHTHKAMYDEDNNYLNTGDMITKFVSYVSITQNDIRLVEDEI